MRYGFIIAAICLMIVVQGCPAEPVNGVSWTVNNDFSSEIILYTVYESDGKFAPSTYTNPVSVIQAQGTLRVYDDYGSKPDGYVEVKSHPDMKMYFTIPYEGIDPYDINAGISHYVACRTFEDLDWYCLHLAIINFPEDCTVNPDLWKIYDLDKFVELYGPLKAQGWDDVWQKWEQSKEAEAGNFK